MPLLGFKAEFAEAVRVGRKRQTIRAYRKDGRDPKPGDTLYLWTGLRRKWARRLRVEVCLDIRSLVVYWPPSGFIGVDIWLAGERLYAAEADELARADGFDNAKALTDWLAKTHRVTLNEPVFRGFVIRW